MRMVRNAVVATLAAAAMCIGFVSPASANSINDTYSCTGTFSGGMRITTTAAGAYVNWHYYDASSPEGHRTRLVDGSNVFYHGKYQPRGSGRANANSVVSGYGTCVQ